jgi:hypothetical protein
MNVKCLVLIRPRGENLSDSMRYFLCRLNSMVLSRLLPTYSRNAISYAPSDGRGNRTF